MKRAIRLDCEVRGYNDYDNHWITRFTAIVFVIGVGVGWSVLAGYCS